MRAESRIDEDQLGRHLSVHRACMKGAIVKPIVGRLQSAALLKRLGPGLITGAADDDPSGIATYSQAGAQFGFQLAWTMLLTFPLMVVIQGISARIGRTTGRGIAANIRTEYSAPLLHGTVLLLLVANVCNIGADLGAMAESARLLVPGLSTPVYLVAF